MVVGLRMGLLALRRLDARGWFDLRCRVRLRWNPPDSCVIDGIQSSTGCTMGKKNLEKEDDNGISAEFTKCDKRITISLRKEVLNNIKNILSDKNEKRIKELIKELKSADDSEIFNII